MANTLKYFRITAVEDTTIRLETVGSPSSIELEYKTSTDSDWSSFYVDTDYTILTDEWIEIRGQNTMFSIDQYSYYNFTSTGQIDVSGLLYSLMNYNVESAYLQNETGCFAGLFRYCQVRNAKDLVFPYKSTSSYAYAYMFANCQGLESLPLIDGYGYGHYGYAYMFYEAYIPGLTLVINRTDMQDQNEMFVWFVSPYGGDGGIALITNQNVDIPTSVIPDNWHRTYVDDSLHDYLTLSNINTYSISLVRINCNDEDNVPLTLRFWARPETSNGLMPWRRVFPGIQFEITGSERNSGITKILLKGECLGDPNDWFDKNEVVLNWNNAGIHIDSNCRVVSGKLSEFVDWRNPLADDYVNLLASLCSYKSFFSNNILEDCSGLVLPAMDRYYSPDHMFDSMFYYCARLTSAPELPSTNFVSGCFANMFRGCTSLTQAPELPAIELKDNCYYSMFMGCTSLTQAPELPATSLAANCYDSMFNGCAALIEAPELPATTLANTCYRLMFYGCKSLTTAPELPAMTLVASCYNGMFNGCIALVEAPELPATTLANTCYYNMFRGCTSLKKVPKIAGTTFGSNSFLNMFYGCSNLNELTYTSNALPTASNLFANWMYDVATTGTFYYTDDTLDVLKISRSPNGVPAGWTIQYLAPKPSLVFSINGKAVTSLTINGKTVSKLG